MKGADEESSRREGRDDSGNRWKDESGQRRMILFGSKQVKVRLGKISHRGRESRRGGGNQVFAMFSVN